MSYKKNNILKGLLIGLIVCIPLIIISVGVNIIQSNPLQLEIERLTHQLDSLQSDTIFYNALYKTEAGKDTIIPVTKEGIYSVVVESSRRIPQHDDLMKFANWVIPAMNQHIIERGSDTEPKLLEWKAWLELEAAQKEIQDTAKENSNK